MHETQKSAFTVAHVRPSSPNAFAFTIEDAQAVGGSPRTKIYDLAKRGELKLIGVAGRTTVDDANLCALPGVAAKQNRRFRLAESGSGLAIGTVIENIAPAGEVFQSVGTMNVADTVNQIDRLHIERGANSLHRLGPAATACLMVEFSNRIGGLPCIISCLTE